MKYPIFLVSFFIFSACSFNSTIETRHSKVGDASRPADISSILEKKKVLDRSLDFSDESLYRDYFSCDRGEFNYRNCNVETGKIIDAYTNKLKFDFQIDYKFQCSRSSSTEKINISLKQNGSIERLHLTGSVWTSLKTYDGALDVQLVDHNPQYTSSILIPNTEACVLNLRTKKVLSKAMIERTRTQIDWISDLYSFYKPLINTNTPLSKQEKERLKTTVYSMEKTLIDVINEVKTSLLYDNKRVFDHKDRQMIYKIARKLR